MVQVNFFELSKSTLLPKALCEPQKKKINNNNNTFKTCSHVGRDFIYDVEKLNLYKC